MTLEQKTKRDRKDYETLCRLKGTYPMLPYLDWYWHFNEMKKLLKDGK